MEKTKPWPVRSQTQDGAVVDCGYTATSASTGNIVAITSKSKNLCAPWPKGVSGNPAGRPKGSKHRISELARGIVAEDFAEHGKATLSLVRSLDPVAYFRIVLKFVPKEIILKQEQQGLPAGLSGMTIEEFTEVLEDAGEHLKRERMLEEFVKWKRETK
jgi:hypothetical protein